MFMPQYRHAETEFEKEAVKQYYKDTGSELKVCKYKKKDWENWNFNMNEILKHYEIIQREILEEQCAITAPKLIKRRM
jgi:hypothetical protein